MNAANAITVARILLIPVFVVLLFSEVPYGDYMAVAVFAIAAGTDKLDGYVARKRKTITATGIFLDPLADKLLVSAALIALVSLDELPAWVAMVIIGREFAVTALRLVGQAQGVSIPADKLGKAKTASQIIAILWLLLAPESLRYGDVIGQILMYIAVALTIVSGVQYFWNGRELLARPPKNPAAAGDDIPSGDTGPDGPNGGQTSAPGHTERGTGSGGQDGPVPAIAPPDAKRERS